ncbi:MAG: DUF1573 domain-containing protein [Saprospiraceae bacterium]|nr:DUF1573 domain-containing protein [Saprospiraceae bacterium]
MKKLIFGFALSTALLALAACGSDQAESAAETSPEQIENGTANPASDVTVSSEPGAEAEVPSGPTTQMTFTTMEYDFGKVKSGETVTHDYEFTNTGKENLIIANAKGSCGCTVPQWPKEPIAPGKTAVIKVVFDSKGKSGPQSKRVTITANTNPPQTFLEIKGEVTPPAKNEISVEQKK